MLDRFLTVNSITLSKLDATPDHWLVALIEFYGVLDYTVFLYFQET